MEVPPKLLLIVLFASVMLKPAQARDRMVYEKASNDVTDESETQETFQNLFDSIAVNDKEKSDVYRKILRQEVAKSRQNFNAAEEGLRKKQNANANKQSSFYTNVDDSGENIVAIKREIKNDDSDTAKFAPNGSLDLYPRTFRAMGPLPPDGNVSYPELDDATLNRTERLLTDVDQLAAKGGKSKYAVGKKRYTPKPPSGKIRLQIYYQQYLKLFGQNDAAKMKQLQNFRFGYGPHNLCYMQAYETFLEHCFYAYYERGGLRPIRNLIGNACAAEWLSLDKIKDIFEKTCGGALVPNARNGFVFIPPVEGPLFMQPIGERAAANNFTPKGPYALCGRYNVDGREMNLVQFTAQPFSCYVKDVGINKEGKQCYTVYFPNVPSHAVQ